MGIFTIIMLLYAFSGKTLAEKVSRVEIDRSLYVLSEEIPLYSPDLVRFATLYVYTNFKDTFSVITGDNTYSRPVYEFGHGTYRFKMYRSKYGGYKDKKVIYAGYSTFFIYNGSSYYDVRFFKHIQKDDVRRKFYEGVKFMDYREKWEKYTKNLFKLDEYAQIDSVPAFLWSYGCSPTSSAMILGYWDKKGYGRLIDYYFDHYDVVLGEMVSNVPNVQKELAVYMYTDTTTGGTWWSSISSGTEDCANVGNGYSFISNWLYGSDDAYDTSFMYLKQEVDSGRPVHWAVGNYQDPYGRIIEHSTCAFGYQVSGADTFVILHNTWDKGTWAWPLYTTDSTYIAIYNVIPGGAISGNINQINAPRSIVNNLYFPLNVVYDDTQSIQRCELYMQDQNGDEWSFVGNILKDSLIFIKKDFNALTKTRFLIKTFDANGSLISSESSIIPSGIVYPVFLDGIFQSKAFCSIEREPFVINTTQSTILVGTSHGIVALNDADSLMYKDTTLNDTVFLSSQYGDYIIYGKNAEGFSIYLGDSLIYHDTTLNYVQDVDIDDSVACVFERNSGMRIIHYRDGFYQDTVTSGGLFFMTGAVFRDYVYVGTLTKGVLVYNVSSNQFVDTMGTGRVWDIAVSRNSKLLYVLFNGYVKVYDITVLDNPSLVDSIPVSNASHIRSHENRFFVVKGDEGVDIYSVSSSGYLKSSIMGIGTVNDVCEKDSTLYITTGEGLVYKVIYLGSGIKEEEKAHKIKDYVLKGGILDLGGDYNNKKVYIYSPCGRLLRKTVVKGGKVSLMNLNSRRFILKIGERTIKVIKIN